MIDSRPVRSSVTDAAGSASAQMESTISSDNRVDHASHGRARHTNTQDSLRILCLTAGLDPESGGSTTAIIDTCRAAEVSGVEVLVAVVGERPPRADVRALLERVTPPLLVQPLLRVRFVPRLAAKWGLSFSLIPFLARRGRSFRVVHVHGAWTFTTLVAVAASVVTRQRVVLSPHETLTDFDVGKSRPLLRVMKRLLRRLYLHQVAALVLASALERDDSLAGDMRALTRVVYHAVDDPSLRALRTTQRMSSPGLLRVGYLGRFDAKKNLDMLLRAVAELGDGVELRVAGDGPRELRSAMHDLAESLAITHRVDWLGFIASTERPAFLSSIDVLAMPSSYECFGVSAAEAMLAGRAVVVGARTGVGEIVRRYRAGFVVQPAVPELAAALRVLQRRPQLRNRLGERGARAADEHFSLEGHGKALAELYRRVLEESPGRYRRRRRTTETVLR